MNWSKTKSILIIALIITNCILIWYLVSEHQKQYNVKVADRMIFEDVRKILGKQNITMSFEEYPGVDRAFGVEASFEVYNLKSLAPKFLGANYQISDDKTEMYTDGKRLRSVGETLLIYEDYQLPESDTLAEEQAFQKARIFLEQIGYYSESDIILLSNRVVGNDRELIFSQQLNRNLIYDGYMRMLVSDKGVRQFERKWFVAKRKNTSVEIIPPGRALMLLPNQIPMGDPDAKVVLTSMEIDYILDSDLFNTSVFSGDLTPYWRFTTRSGEVYHVNATQ